MWEEEDVGFEGGSKGNLKVENTALEHRAENKYRQSHNSRYLGRFRYLPFYRS